MASRTPRDPVSHLYNELSGQALHIPDMRPFFSTWPAGTNPNLERLRKFVDEHLERVVASSKDLERLKKCDFGWFTALWYPFAEWEKLRVVALFCVWLFVWDDEIDMSEGQFHGDFEKAQANFQSTLEFTRWALGLDSSDSQEPDKEVGEGIRCSAITRGLFGAFGALFRQDAAQETKQRLYREIEFYIGQVAKEHGINIRRQILSTDDYLDIRLGTSGSYTLTAFLDYTTSTTIPSFIMESEEMKSLRYEENIMTILINDIYSLKKEMKYGVLTSMLPIEYNTSDHKDLSRVMDQTMTRMEHSSKAFDEAAKGLKKMATSGRYDDDTIVEGLSSWIANSRTLLTGCLEYHLKTKRYSMDSYLQSDGAVNLTL